MNLDITLNEYLFANCRLHHDMCAVSLYYGIVLQQDKEPSTGYLSIAVQLMNSVFINANLC